MRLSRLIDDLTAALEQRGDGDVTVESEYDDERHGGRGGWVHGVSVDGEAVATWVESE